MTAKRLVVACGGPHQRDSFAINSATLATLATYEGCSCSPSKHAATFSAPFILTFNCDQTPRLSSTHVIGLVGKCDNAIALDIACIHSDGNYLAAGGPDGLLRLWHTSGGDLVVEQDLGIGSLSVVFVDPTLWTLCAASCTGKIGIWSIPELIATCEPDRIWSIHSARVTDLALGWGTNIFSVSVDGTAKCFDYCSGCVLFSLTFPVSLTCCALQRSESILYCGGSDGNIYQIEINSDPGVQAVFSGHTQEICDLLVSDDDYVLFSCAADSTVRRWETKSGEMLNEIRISGIPFSLHQTIDVVDTHDRNPQKKPTLLGEKRNLQDLRKSFPRLFRTVNVRRDELVSAHFDDIPILSIADEIALAVGDVCHRETMEPFDVVGPDGKETDDTV
jgi:hypothetical protein